MPDSNDLDNTLPFWALILVANFGLILLVLGISELVPYLPPDGDWESAAHLSGMGLGLLYISPRVLKVCRSRRTPRLGESFSTTIRLVMIHFGVWLLFCQYFRELGPASLFTFAYLPVAFLLNSLIIHHAPNLVVRSPEFARPDRSSGSHSRRRRKRRPGPPSEASRSS